MTAYTELYSTDKLWLLIYTRAMTDVRAETDAERRARYLREVRAIVLRCFQRWPAKVWLFGSFARGEERTASDIDIAVEPGPEVPPSALSAIEEALEEGTIPYFVDLVDLRAAGDRLRAMVLNEGVPWLT